MSDSDGKFTEQETKALRQIARQQIEQWPTRRQALAGMAGASALAFGAGSVTADAGDAGMNGQIGTAANPYDGFARAVEYQDTTTDPSSNGNIQRNGADIKAHSGGAVRNLSDIGSGGGGATLASNNDASLPDIQTAINNASSWDTVIVVPGEHDITSTVTISNPLNFILRGVLMKQADVTALEIGNTCNLTGMGRKDVIDTNVADTTPGIEYNYKTTTNGMVAVGSVGGIGHYFHQDSTSDNLNGSRVILEATACGSDGVKLENTSGTAGDLNGMRLEGILLQNGGHGFNGQSGSFGCMFEWYNVEGNGDRGVYMDGPDSNITKIGNAESNTNAYLEYTANSDNNDHIVGNPGTGFTDNGSGNTNFAT